MKTQKLVSKLLSLCLAFSLTSCLFGSKTEGDPSYFESSDTLVFQLEKEDQNDTPVQQSNGIQYFEEIDRSNGLVSNRIPYPANWKRSTQQGSRFEGPNGERVSGPEMANFSFTNNPEAAWMLQQQGIQNTPPMTVDQVIQQLFMPIANKTGRRLVNKYPLPKQAQRTLNFMNLLFTSVPVSREVYSYGLEWKDDQGMSYFTILTLQIVHSQPTSDWNVSSHYVQAPNAHFKKAKEAFLFAELNNEVNPNWLYAVNKRDAQRAGMSYQAHQARMAAISMRGNTSKSVGSTYSDILDISHSGYLKRSDMTSHGQARTVNMIGERAIIANHGTGEHYNVPDGSKYYWVGNDGTYFGTDNPNYDPRTDRQINQVEWTLFEKEQ